LNAAGAERVVLSMAIATSALFRAGRLLEPEKITSSIDEARMDLCEDSPMTHAALRPDLISRSRLAQPRQSGLVQSGNPSVRRTT
jgi:hypothetical protein